MGLYPCMVPTKHPHWLRMHATHQAYKDLESGVSVVFHVSYLVKSSPFMSASVVCRAAPMTAPSPRLGRAGCVSCEDSAGVEFDWGATAAWTSPPVGDCTREGATRGGDGEAMWLGPAPTGDGAALAEDGDAATSVGGERDGVDALARPMSASRAMHACVGVTATLDGAAAGEVEDATGGGAADGATTVAEAASVFHTFGAAGEDAGAGEGDGDDVARSTVSDSPDDAAGGRGPAWDGSASTSMSACSPATCSSATQDDGDEAAASAVDGNA